MPNPGPSHAPTHQQDSRWSSPQIRRLYPELLDYRRTSASEVIERARELSPLHNPSRNLDEFRRSLENITKHKPVAPEKVHDTQGHGTQSNIKASNGRHGSTDTPPKSKPASWPHDNTNNNNSSSRALTDKTNRHDTPNRRPYTSESTSKPPNTSASPSRVPPQYNTGNSHQSTPGASTEKAASNSKDINNQPNTSAYDNSRVITSSSPHRQFQRQHSEAVIPTQQSRQPHQETTSSKITNTEQRSSAYCTPSRRPTTDNNNITPSRRDSHIKNDANSNPSQCFAPTGDLTMPKRTSNVTTNPNPNDVPVGPALTPTIPPPTTRSIPVMIPPTTNQYVESKWNNNQPPLPPPASSSPHRYVSPFQRALPQQSPVQNSTPGLPPTSPPKRFCSPSRPAYEPQPPPTPPLRSYSPHHRMPLDNSLEMSPPSSPLHATAPSQPVPTTAFFTYADPLSPQSRICVPFHLAKPHMTSKNGPSHLDIMNENEPLPQGGPHAPLKIMISSSAPNNIKRQVYSPVNGRTSDLPISPNSNNTDLVSPTSCSSPQTSLVLTNSTSPHSPANPCSVYSPTQRPPAPPPHHNPPITPQTPILKQDMTPSNAIYTNLQQTSSQGPPMAPLFNSPPNNSHKELPNHRPEPVPMMEVPKPDNIKPLPSRAVPGPSSSSHLVSLSHPSLPGVGDLSTCGVPTHIWKDPSAGSASRPVGSPTPSRNRWTSSTPKDPIRPVVPPFRELTIPMVASLAAPLPPDDRWKVPDMSFVNNAENNERFQNETPSTLEGSMSQPMNSREWVREPASYPRAPSPEVRNTNQSKPQKTAPQSTPDIHWCRHSDDKTSISSLSSKGSLTVESGRSSAGGVSDHLTAATSTSSTQCKLADTTEDIPINEMPKQPPKPKLDPSKDLYDALVRGVTSKTQLSRYIKAGADPNYRDSETGDTALIKSCDLKSTRIMTLFLDCSQLELDATDTSGCTALHKCSKLKWLEGMKALINAGASVNCSEMDGRTPLMICCDAGFLNGANLLLTTGGLIDMQDCAGRTALQRVNELIEMGVEDITKEKLEHIKDLLTAAAAASVAYQ